MSYVRTMIKAIEPGSAEIDLYLPKTIVRQWKIPSSAITVQFGSKTDLAKVVGTGTKGITRIRASLVRFLHLPTGIPLLARYHAGERKLIFGPFIGILLSSYAEQNPTDPFGTFTPFLNEIAQLCRKRGMIACAFRLQDVNWEAETVKALVQIAGDWQMQTMPLPQCIYNRLISRKTEKTELMSEWIERCKESRIPFFNERFLNKWHVHKALETESKAQPFLPKTIVYHNQQNLQDMLLQHRLIYLKPSNGSMGKGIYRIIASAEGYKLTRATSNGTVTKRFTGLGALHNYLQKKINNKTYLLQQGLMLISFDKKPSDFRVLVQKNRKGDWAVTSLVARLGHNSVVSNIARGGSMMSASQALNLCGPWRTIQRPSVHTLKHVALQLARLLETVLDGHYAEFGIDLGVDVNGRIWLLEVNSKPSKSVGSTHIPTDENETKRRPRPSVFRMLDYAAFLSGFPIVKKQQSKVNPTKKKNRR